MKRSKVLQGLGIAALLISLLIIVVGCNTETPVARSYSTACYREQGGSKWVCGDGGEMEFQSGATLDVQSGAAVTLADSTIYGNLVVTGTSDLQGDVADSVGDFTVADDTVVTGTLTANGAGDFDLTLNVDGASTLGGLLTLNDNLVVTGTSDLQGNVSDSVGDFTIADNAVVTGTSDLQGDVADSLGDFTIADNTVVTGTLTANGAGDFDLTLNVDGATTLGGLLTLNDNLVVTGTSDLQGNVADSVGDFTIADNAVVTGSLTANGAGDFDLTLNVDGASTLGGLLTLNDNLVVTGTSDLQGNVSDSVGDFTIADNAVVTGTSDLQGDVADSLGDFTIADNTVVTGTLTANGAGDFDLTLNVDGATTLGGLLTLNDNLVVTGTSDLQGNVADSVGDFTIADNAVVTGSLTANGAGDFDLTLNVDGATTLGGLLTLNDNLVVTGTSDLQGNVSDSVGDFTIADNAIVTGTLDVQGASLQYGPNDLYPMGASSSGFQMVWGSTTITNSGTVAHGLTSPAWGSCTYSGTLTDNEEQKCSVNISGSTVTIYTYKEDGTAGDSGVPIYWMVIGTP